MADLYTYVPYGETGFFSTLVNDYLSAHQNTTEFYNYAPNAEGIAQAIEERNKYPVDRQVLVDTLKQQYSGLAQHTKVTEHIDLLCNENTFTICTAHQPNLLTGYLYFVYKILHAIKLAEELSAIYPGKHFVPVYYMGSEDNDLDELGTFRFRGDKYVWDGGGQTGAVGRMDTKSLKTLLQNVFKYFGPLGAICDELQTMITQAYGKHNTIGAATHYLVNELFGRFGLVVINPDDAALKKCYIPVMEDELLNQNSLPILDEQITRLGTNYKIQAHPRAINLFYLADQLRERIEKKEDRWVVLNTNISWDKEALLNELYQHPERFSPNVMLRGMFQESILPNVVFIGGGAEVAYWLQLKTLFEHYHVFYPCIHLRQSVMWVTEPARKLINDLGFSVTDTFKPEQDLIKHYIGVHTTLDLHTNVETTAIESILNNLQTKAQLVDPTLAPAAGAALTKMRHQLKILEQKMLRAEKKKMQVQVDKITRLKKILYPSGGLQERVENFMDYYLEYGSSFFDTVKDGIDPLHPQFLIIN